MGRAGLTHFPLADDQVGVAEHLLLVVGIEDFALPQVGCDARGVDDRDELHPEALQRAPALVLILVVRHGGSGGWVQASSWEGPRLTEQLVSARTQACRPGAQQGSGQI